MRRFRDLAIRNKLKLIITLTSVIALVVACAAFAAYGVITFRHEMKRNLSTLAGIIGANSTAALIFDDQDSAAVTLATLGDQSHILAGCIYSSDGREFSRYLRSGVSGACPPGPVFDGYHFRADHFSLSKSIVFKGEKVGTIYLKSDLVDLHIRLSQYAGIVVLVLSVSSLLAFLLSSKIQGLISGPILHLVQTAKHISDKQDYSVRAVKVSNDESGLLIDTFNEMLSQIQGRDEKLRIQERDRVMRRQEQHFRSLIENASDIITILDADGTIRYESPSIERIHGGKAEDLIGKNIAEFVHPENAPMFTMAIAKASEKPGGSPPIEFRFRRSDDSWVSLEATINKLLDDSGVPRVVVNSRDITERKSIDVLTGLPNRPLFMDRLGHSARRRRQGEKTLFAVLFLDLDRFKTINDSLGHSIGDQLLIQVARRLEKCLRQGDTVARLGGDEFTILLEEIKDETDATRVAERVREELSVPCQVEGHEVFTTSSIGIALSSTGYAQPEDLLRDADTAMYRAKALGKACYSMFDTTMHERAVALLQLDQDLRRALERKEFRLHYQPIVRLETAELIGFEALLRWEHPGRGFVSPAEFIPLAEETRLIISIGRWVLEEACRQVRAWQAKFGADLPVSVNLSGRQLSQPDLVDQITHILQQFSLDGRSLKLEITESMTMENIESVITMLRQLKALGIQLSMDDFGTGYSSLSYLHRLPIDVLKIDRSFVSGTHSGVEKPEVVRTVLTLAFDRGIDTIAEGVETVEQMAQLKALGCKYGQGYLFSKPLDGEAAGKWIAERLQPVKGI